MKTIGTRSILCCVLTLAAWSLGAKPSPTQIRNWPAPPFWNPAPGSVGLKGNVSVTSRPLRIQTDLTGPLPFIAVAPCRMLDTRTSGGPIASGTTRDITLTGAPCGIPATALAVSANFAVFDISGTSSNGVLTVWPTGSPATLQALVNWSPASGQIDNAAVVPLGTGGAVTVKPNQGTGTINLVIDVNGYFGGSNTFQPSYARTVVVGPVGTASQNGAALLGALASITTASATNPWLLKIEPGIYDIGSSTLGMKPYVDIEGSGELSTTVMSSSPVNTFTVLGTNNAELRFLSLSASSGGPNFAVAYVIQSGASRITHVTITANDTGGGAATGISVENGSNLVIDHVRVTATATSGGQSVALGCSLGSSALVGSSTLNAVGGGIQSNGISVQGGAVTLQNSVVSAVGAPNNLGISTSAGAMVTVDSSQIIASTNTILSTAPATTFVGATKLSGGPVAGGGTTTCAGVYDGSYTFFANTCP